MLTSVKSDVFNRHSSEGSLVLIRSLLGALCPSTGWYDALTSKIKNGAVSEGEQLSGLLAHVSIVRAVGGVCRVPGVSQFSAGTPLVPLQLG